MPKRDTAPAGAPCWIELYTSDAARARAFYTEVFGWTADEPNEAFGGYFSFRKDGVRIAGCMGAQPGVGTPDLWSIYLQSDDAAKTVDLAIAHGGQAPVTPMPVGDMGTMAFVTDPGGAGVGVWQPNNHSGFGLLGDPDTPGWFELMTRDYDPTLQFYRDVFQWNTESVDTDEFRYTVQKDGDEQLAGVMDAADFMPKGAPARWSVYFAIADADATIAKVRQLGGSVEKPAENTPFGRLATVADPTGSQFKLAGPASS
jgi:predicted enzyme related to lactoylglutathione lyase